jgi:hypothetical protein
MAGTLFAEGIGFVVTEEWFGLDIKEYTAYVAGFFLILTAVYNPEGIDGFQRKQIYSLANFIKRKFTGGSVDSSAPPGETAQSTEVAT